MAITTKEIRQLFASTPEADKLITLFSLRQFCASAFYPKNFQISEAWDEALSLTPAGTKMFDLVRMWDSAANSAFAKRVVFMSFYYEDLFVDHQATDLKQVYALMSEEVRASDIILPSRFGRALYDAFNDKYLGQRIDSLDPEQSGDLLQGWPQGIYQVGKFVSGPFGLVESNERRYVAPTLRLPLWHCQDVGCSRLHEVMPIQFPRSPLKEMDRLDSFLRDTIGAPAPWETVLVQEIDFFEGGKKFYDLVAFFGDCLLDAEVAAIFKLAIAGPYSSVIREVISQDPKHKKLRNKSPDQILRATIREHQLQLLLRLRDEDLVRIIDEVVSSGAIRVARTESRRLRVSPPKGSYADCPTEISQLGMRSFRGNPIRNLENLIFDAHQNFGLLEKLAWRLRSTQEVDVRYAIAKHVARDGEASAIRDFLLADPDIVKFVENRFSGLLLGDDERHNARRVAWRLGFVNRSYDDKFSILEDRLRAFEGILRAMNSVSSEVERAAIRSVGVNLFVSVEEVLEELIAFNVWLLSQDHHGATKFAYTYERAMDCVGDVLEGASSEGSNWSSLGQNTLGSLLASLDLTLKWMQSLPGCNAKELKSPLELPHYADEEGRVFPYRHRQLWADANGRELLAYISNFELVVKALRNAKVAMVRNGLDHKRPKGDFPKVGEMLTCCRFLDEAMKVADAERIYPKTFWNTKIERDISGATRWTYEDRKSGFVELSGPSVVSGDREFSDKSPQIIAPGNLLGYPNSEIVFSSVEETDYVKYWSSYPRRAAQ